MTRYYLVPKTGDGKSRETGFRPAYVPAGHGMTCMDFGGYNLFLVSVDLKNQDHSELVAHPDVLEVKDPEAVSARLASAGLPVVRSSEAAAVVRDLRGIALCEQRSHAIHGKRTADLSDVEAVLLAVSLGLSRAVSEESKAAGILSVLRERMR